MLLPGWAKANISFLTMIKIDSFCKGWGGNTRVCPGQEAKKKQQRQKEGSEKKKTEEETEWRKWMSDLRDKGIFQTIPYHYLACHVTPVTGFIN